MSRHANVNWVLPEGEGNVSYDVAKLAVKKVAR
jgi:hypothetical protein